MRKAKDAAEGLSHQQTDQPVKKPAKLIVEERKAEQPRVQPNETMMEGIANWFKDVLNVCGNSGCCASKNPYYDEKTWEDIN